MWARLRHVEKMVVVTEAIVGCILVQRVFHTLFRARVVEGIFEISSGVEFDGVRPQFGSDPLHLLRVLVPHVNVINEMRRGFSLPHKGDLISLNDGVSVFTVASSRRFVFMVDIVIDLRDAWAKSQRSKKVTVTLKVTVTRVATVGIIPAHCSCLFAVCF
jgi:hypothetical protein